MTYHVHTRCDIIVTNLDDFWKLKIYGLSLRNHSTFITLIFYHWRYAQILKWTLVWLAWTHEIITKSLPLGKGNSHAFNLKICLKHGKKWDIKLSRIAINNYGSHLHEYLEWCHGKNFPPSVNLLIPKLYFYLLHSSTQTFNYFLSSRNFTKFQQKNEWLAVSVSRSYTKNGKR